MTPAEAGRRWAVEHVLAAAGRRRPPTPRAGGSASWPQMIDVLQEWGYTPELRTTDGGRVAEVTLAHCPFLDLARDEPGGRLRYPSRPDCGIVVAARGVGDPSAASSPSSTTPPASRTSARRHPFRTHRTEGARHERRPRRTARATPWSAPAGSSRGREVSDDHRTIHETGGRDGDAFYRDRWSHDKVVRSTHGVNCTGSCSWKVYVKDGIITWETQQTDYPSVGAGLARSTSPAAARAARRSPGTPTRPPGCATPTCAACCSRCTARPRRSTAATRSWRGRTSSRTPSGPGATSRPAARAAWSAPPGTRRPRSSPPRTCTRSRSTARTGSPASRRSRRCRWSRTPPAPGSLDLIGGSMLSFYDWYADLPVASPQVFGDQTDVPESGDWWDAGYLIMWGSNVPVTRTPDAHWMTEARYRGQKVVAVAPDYADNVKFADEWLPAAPGTDGALAMAMGHVMLKEFFVDRQVAVLHRLRRRATPTCRSWSGPASRRPRRRPGIPAGQVPHRRRPRARRGTSENAAFKTVLDRRAHRRAGRARTARSATASARRGVGQVEPRPRRRRPAAHPARHRRPRPCVVAAAALRHPRRRGRRRCRAACRSAGSAATWSPPCSTCCSPSTASAATACRATWPTGYDDAVGAVHPGLAGGDHRRAGRARPRGSAREFAAERRGLQRPLDDPDGRRHQPLVPLRHDLPRVPHADHAHRLPGRQRRRLGALRRPGEGPPDHRLRAARLRASTGTGRRGR